MISLRDNLVLSLDLMKIGHPKEFLRLKFQALALHLNNYKNSQDIILLQPFSNFEHLGTGNYHEFN